MTCLRALLLLLLLISAAPAENLPREFTLTSTEIKEAPPYLTKVVVPDASCAAVNDAASLLIIGRKGKDEKHLAVYRLDAEGKASGEPTWITLPKPAVLAANFNYPLGLLFHPSLPILYVWQDINGPPGSSQEKNPEFVDYLDFDHLLIYAIKDGALELIGKGAHGAGFHCGLTSGTVGLDYGAKTLFVPNSIGQTSDEGGIGFFSLDEQGLPGDVYEAEAAGANKQLKVKVGKDPSKVTTRMVPVSKHSRSYRYYPTGGGWFAGAEAIIMGGYSGCMVGDFHDGALRQTWFDLPDLTGPCLVAGHPKLPAVYLCLQDNSHLYEISQVNGYLSLLPQAATVTGAHFTSAPIVLAGPGRVAVGDVRAVHFFGLQSDGKLDGKDERLKLPCAMVKGITWSEKHSLLYVAVDKAE